MSETVSLITVLVDNARNLPNPLTGLGNVDYDYRICKYRDCFVRR